MAVEFPVGINLIREMSREELIEEILANQRAQLEAMELVQLRGNVASFRIAEMTKRIQKEAGIELNTGVFGGTHVREVDDDE